MEFFRYSDKSAAKRGLARKFPDCKGKEDAYICQQDGKWGFNLHKDGGPLPKLSVDDTYLNGNDPHAKSDGDKIVEAAMTSMAQLDVKGSEDQDREMIEAYDSKPENDAVEFQGTDAELPAAIEKGIKEGEEDDHTPASSAFGAFALGQLANGSRPSVSPAPRPQVITKIEKNRPEQNGIKRPSAGTLCAQVWDLAFSLSDLSEHASVPHSRVATLSQVIKAAEGAGINKFTARTQYARWRVFNGIIGRLS